MTNPYQLYYWHFASKPEFQTTHVYHTEDSQNVSFHLHFLKLIQNFGEKYAYAYDLSLRQ